MRTVRALLLLLAMLAAVLATTACEPTSGGRGCSFTRPAAAPAFAGDGAIKPKPRPAKTRTVNTCNKANSPEWQKYKPYKGNWRTDGKGKYYQWDNLHGDIEQWERRGGRLHHLGSLDPNNGTRYKGPKHPPQALP